MSSNQDRNCAGICVLGMPAPGEYAGIGVQPLPSQRSSFTGKHSRCRDGCIHQKSAATMNVVALIAWLQSPITEQVGSLCRCGGP